MEEIKEKYFELERIYREIDWINEKLQGANNLLESLNNTNRDEQNLDYLEQAVPRQKERVNNLLNELEELKQTYRNLFNYVYSRINAASWTSLFKNLHLKQEGDIIEVFELELVLIDKLEPKNKRAWSKTDERI